MTGGFMVKRIKEFFIWLWEKIKGFFKKFDTEQQVKEIIDEIKENAVVETIDAMAAYNPEPDPAVREAVREYENRGEIVQKEATPYVRCSVRNFSKVHPGRHTVYGTPRKHQ